MKRIKDMKLGVKVLLALVIVVGLATLNGVVTNYQNKASLEKSAQRRADERERLLREETTADERKMLEEQNASLEEIQKVINDREQSSDLEVQEVDGADNSWYLKHGEPLDWTENDGILVVKAKIEPNLTNKLTISQNEFNVEDIIKNQGGDQFNEIQYWAVADMEDGSESKVISFTLNSELIQGVMNGNVPANQIIDHADDVWILPSLTK